MLLEGESGPGLPDGRFFACISCNFHNLHGSCCCLFLDFKEKEDVKLGLNPGFLIHDNTVDVAVSNVTSGPLIFLREESLPP